MDTFNLRILNSHYLLVTEDEKKFLIDTGSPISFCGGCDNMYITLGGTEYTIRPNSVMIDKLNCGDLFQDRADGLIGMDILEGHSFEFDKVNNVIIVDAELDENAYSHSINHTNHMTICIDKDYEKVMRIKATIERNLSPFSLVVTGIGLYRIWPGKLISQY